MGTRIVLRCGMRMESLEPRQLLAGVPMITEFMAKNDGFLEDGDGNTPDWIEIQNVSDTAIDLAGYRLTDTPTDLARWVFPSVRLDPGEYLVVFASARDENNYVDAGGNLHTNFGLSAGGEYLALVAPDGTVLSQYGTTGREYPEQTGNISYGVPQRELLLTGPSEATFWVPLGQQVDSVWTATDFDALAHGFTSGQAAIGYESQPDSRNNFSGEFLTALPAGTHAVYARMEFDLANSSEITRLNLRMKYDNGFIAYLNGAKVAEANAPQEAQWFSTAPQRIPSDSQARNFADFDLTAYVPQLVDGTNVLAIHGLNHISDRDDMLLVPELIASANRPDAKVGYMSLPTPGAENVGAESVFSGILGETQIDGEPGFYDAPFTVTISTETPEAVIRYTTDGRSPTATTGTVYAGPIQISTTTTLRAGAFKDGYIPSRTATQSYLFLDNVIRQPDQQPGLPSSWRWSARDWDADYGMDQRIVNDPAYRNEIVEGLKSIRTMSIVMDPDDLFGPEGMHNNTERHGLDSEHPASLEILNPDGSLAVHVDAGFRIHGNFTRHYDVTRKMSFRLTFRDQYGATKLEYPLFTDSPVDQFDNIILHAGKLFDDVQLVGNSFGRDTNRAMGNIDAHATYVHLYLNGLYWGLYNPIERPDSQFAAEYFGGRDQDYDAILENSEAVDGDTRLYNQMLGMIRSGLRTEQAYEEFLRYVDLDTLLDYLLVNQYIAHNEHELRAIGSRIGDPKFRFFIWDVDEQPLNNVRAREDIDTYLPAGIFDQLRRHPEISMRYADRAHKHLFNGGALTPEAAAQRWNDRYQEIFSAVIAETARWGDMTRNRPYTRDVDMQRQQTRLTDEFFPGRTQVLIDELRRLNVYPDIDAPNWNQYGGPVPTDFQLSMTNPGTSGIILYTLDGTDPRQYGGTAAPGALLYEGLPIAITGDTLVKARVLASGDWSALSEGQFFVVGPDSPFHLRVTEINYHPHDANLTAGLGEANVDSSHFQYVELTNTGAQTIDIGGVKLSRDAKFAFPTGTTLAAGQRVMVVSDRGAFESRYGASLNIAGQFDSGSLSEVQALLELRDAAGRRMQLVSYSGLDPWPQRADGRGSSLEIIDPFAAASEPESWRSSSQFGGSPGSAGLGPDRQIAITEVLAHSALPAGDMIELQNSSSAAVDVSNWYVSNSRENYFMHKIAAGTTIPAGGYRVLTETVVGFGLSGSRGGEVWLIQTDSNGKPWRFIDHAQFGPSAAGVSMGPGPGTGGRWLPLAEQTFGRANTGLLVGEVTISEVHFAPLDPDGDRRQMKANDFEYIELYNRTDSTQDISDWRLSGGVDVTFPSGTLIDARKALLVVPFDPTDRTKGSIFRVVHNVDPTVPLAGPYSDTLQDDGDAVRLERPDQPAAEDPAFTPYLYVDEVTYQVIAPWPLETVGTGSSLTRVSAEGFGNSAASWTASAISPGAVDFARRLAGDANEDGRFNQLDLVQVLQGGKYQTQQPATWREGDWDGDGVFDPLDLVAALQTGNYLGPLAALASGGSSGVKSAHAIADENLMDLDRLFAQLGG